MQAAAFAMTPPANLDIPQITLWQLIKRLSLPQRVRLAVAFARLVHNPERTAEVFKMIEPFLADPKDPDEPLARYLAWVLALPGVAKAYESGTLPSPPDLHELAKLPSDTFGYAFSQHMLGNGLSVEFYPKVQVTGALTWMEARARQQHDLLHVALGFGVDVAGELGVQAFMAAQLQTPLAGVLIGGGLIHTSLFSPTNIPTCLSAIGRGYEAGARALPALAYPFEERLARPLALVRQELGITN